MYANEFTVIGHRGARGHAPENTLLAIDTAIRLGAPWVEFDVQLHDSGELLVFHDLTLDRTTNGQGFLASQSLGMLRALDAGQGQQIPTLTEVLDLVEQQVGVNIELKSAGGTGEAVASVIRSYLEAGWPPEKFLVSSFHLPELWEFKQYAPEIPIGALICGVPLDWAGCAVELGAATLNLSSEFVDPRLIEDAHKHGIKVFVYTVNDPAEMRMLRGMGVDGVFSDYPDRALAITAG
ncbi:glycerophosphodiester phosphodiesterase family protein [uncultured Nevskia sp.]|uniref:glycerophosphodiester phosphodiesterase n=1 Tax=uncultured Nevskia sp. TaxID=228950 RepID=UPI0025E5314E|nr:glycerophosphodiester phosphodiesterase family protein [uncultured Nevskia sp.]